MMKASNRQGVYMAQRKIRLEGDEVLRKKCRPVTKIDDRIKMLLQDIEDTLKSHDNGAGLAAPQVGILRRMVVVNGPDGLLKLVNPCIVMCRASTRWKKAV